MSISIVRPTKKQRELLEFIDGFIKEHGYSPSYREVMNGLEYTSVATVSLHINNLIRRGHLRKRDRSARSLEVVRAVEAGTPAANTSSAPEEAWLMSRVAAVFEKAEAADEPAAAAAELQTVLDAVRILGHPDISEHFEPRLEQLQSSIT